MSQTSSTLPCICNEQIRKQEKKGREWGSANLHVFRSNGHLHDVEADLYTKELLVDAVTIGN